MLNFRHKKPDARSGFFISLNLGGNKICWVGHGRLAALNFAQGVTYHLFGQASAFAALAGNAEGGAHVTIAAAAFVDGFADLTVSNTFAETHVHIKARGRAVVCAKDTNVNENACQNCVWMIADYLTGGCGYRSWRRGEVAPL